MRSYKAARRASQRAQGQVEPIPFEVSYEDQVPACDPDTCDTPGCLHQDTKLDEVTDTFYAFGEPSLATMTDGAYFADLNLATPAAAAIVRRTFEELIGDRAEFTRFWRIAPLIDDDTLLEIMGDLIEDTIGRPTKPSVTSSEKPSRTTESGVTSKVVSLSRGTVRQLPEPTEEQLAQVVYSD